MGLLSSGRGSRAGPAKSTLLWTELGQEAWAIWSTSLGASVEDKLTQSIVEKTGLAELSSGTKLCLD